MMLAQSAYESMQELYVGYPPNFEKFEYLDYVYKWKRAHFQHMTRTWNP